MIAGWMTAIVSDVSLQEGGRKATVRLLFLEHSLAANTEIKCFLEIIPEAAPEWAKLTGKRIRFRVNPDADS